MRALRTLYRDRLLDLYDSEEIDALCRFTVQDRAGINTMTLNDPLPILTESHLNRIIPVLERLEKGEPYQYIIGRVDFLGCLLKVSPEVLIPRPETEELCELILKENDPARPKTVLDIGTGSGCIPIALQKHAPAWSVQALDVSLTAISLASENAALNQAAVTFFQFDVLSGEALPQKYDLIVSNPPYIPEKEQADILDNVLVHEPHLALFIPNEDPLLFYRMMLKHADVTLNDGGNIYFEINEKYGAQVTQLMRDSGFEDVRVVQDLSGKDRFAVCSKDGQYA